MKGAAVPSSPAFGQADLSNCERELIHLAGSIQPHGVLFTVSEPGLRVLQVSDNVGAWLGLPVESWLDQPLGECWADLEAALRPLLGSDLSEPVVLRCLWSGAAGASPRRCDGLVHRVGDGLLIVEIEPESSDATATVRVDLAHGPLAEQVEAAVDRIGSASSIGTLCDAAVRSMRDLLGYDRVMVYKFDPDGHGQIIAEARDPRLESLLGHHYPASDIPQRARELYVRNRLRVLVDVHYRPAALVPRLLPGSGQELDMSMSYLRSMSPLHLQYLQNMGVTATLVVSLVREGQLWGLVACHHYAPRNLSLAVRTAADLLCEVIATRIAAIENYAHAQVAIQVRRLEQRLIEATSTEGDWRLALLRNPHTLLQPLDASGAALFHEGEVLTTGEVPSTPELRQLVQWVDGRDDADGLYHSACVARENEALASLTATASGVIAVKLAASTPDYLMWFRKEQLTSFTWAGDPTKPVIGNDPKDLSPRRSFAAWSEIVRGTARPWSRGELALARAYGDALVDIIVQVSAVRLLIAEHQLAQFRATVAGSKEPVMVAGADARLLFANEAFGQLVGRVPAPGMKLEDMTDLFSALQPVQPMLASLRDRQSWRGEMVLRRDGGGDVPVSVRAEVVPARDGSVLGYFLVFLDLTDTRRAQAARQHLEELLSEAGADGEAEEGASVPRGRYAPDQVMGAILSNASVAAMDVADGNATASVARVLQEIEFSTQRAAALYRRIRRFGQG